MQTTSKLGIELIKKWEKPVDHIYPDSGGRLTIGIGHLITDAEAEAGYIKLKDGTRIHINSRLTEKEMEYILRKDLAVAESAVQRVTVPLTQNQFDALVVFTFNVGVGGFGSSTLLKLLNKGGYSSVPVQMARWIHETIDGVSVVRKGLINRRNAEIELWQRTSV